MYRPIRIYVMTRGRSCLQHGERRDEDPPLVDVRLDGRRQRAQRRLRHSAYCDYSRPNSLRVGPDEAHSFKLAAGSAGARESLLLSSPGACECRRVGGT